MERRAEEGKGRIKRRREETERGNRGKKKKRVYDSAEDGSEEERLKVEPQTIVREMMTEFPNAGNDLKLLLQMIDDGQAVDIKGISERSLMKHLKKLFLDRVFLLPSKALPTLDVVGPLITLVWIL